MFKCVLESFTSNLIQPRVLCLLAAQPDKVVIETVHGKKANFVPSQLKNKQSTVVKQFINKYTHLINE